MAKFTAQKVNSMVVVVDVFLEKNENQFHIFHGPDHHWDNPKCDRELLREDMDEAKRIGAAIIMPGDTFCLMQGAYDPRKSKSDIRPEHNVSNYIDAVINTAAAWYAPYASNIVALGEGNHEGAILRRLETNVLERFAGALPAPVPVMGYHGFVYFRFHDSHNRPRWYYTVYFNHGSGGGGPVTRGQIELSRKMMHIENADCISMGHIHEKNVSEVMFTKLETTRGVMHVKCRSVLLMRSSTYKQEYADSGFHQTGGRPPKPLGGTFLTLHVSRGEHTDHLTAEAKIKTGRGFNLK